MLKKYFGKRYSDRKEFDAILSELNKAGSKVFIAPTEYFPVGHRGVYHTVKNNFYLNDSTRPQISCVDVSHET